MTGGGTPAGRLAAIWRHPVKSHGRERLASVMLEPGAPLPWDRRWAVLHDAAPGVPPGGWGPSANFMIGTRTAALTAITAELDEERGAVTLAHPDRPTIAFRPDDPADAARFLDWVRPLCPPGRAQPAALVTAGARGMTDTDYPSVSVLNLPSNAALGRAMGAELSALRWRANLWLDGPGPWAEDGWIGREIGLGGAVLRIEEPIVRCRATTADPATGRPDHDTLGALDRVKGARTFGVYARVVEGGRIADGDAVRL